MALLGYTEEQKIESIKRVSSYKVTIQNFCRKYNFYFYFQIIILRHILTSELTSLFVAQKLNYFNMIAFLGHYWVCQ